MRNFTLTPIITITITVILSVAIFITYMVFFQQKINLERIRSDIVGSVSVLPMGFYIYFDEIDALNKKILINESPEKVLTEDEKLFIRNNAIYFYEHSVLAGRQRALLIEKLQLLEASPVGNLSTGEMSFLPDLISTLQPEILKVALKKKMNLSVFYDRYGWGLVELSILYCDPKYNTTKILLDSINRDTVFCADCLKRRYHTTLTGLAEEFCPSRIRLVKEFEASLSASR